MQLNKTITGEDHNNEKADQKKVEKRNVWNISKHKEMMNSLLKRGGNNKQDITNRDKKIKRIRMPKTKLFAIIKRYSRD